MPETFAAELMQDTRSQMADLLNANLKGMIALTLATKQAHWNLKGAGFIGVHELLDEVAGRLRDGADLMAERAVILGAFATGTVEAVSRAPMIDPYPQDMSDIQKHVTTLKQAFMTLNGSVRSAIDAADEAGDQDTADLFTEVSRQLDKDAWFIGANAADQ